MTENFIQEIRSAENLDSAIINSIVLDNEKKLVTVKLLTDKAYTAADKSHAMAALRKYVPEYFGCNVEISKLTPDADMVKEKILEAIGVNFRALSVTIDKNVKSEKLAADLEVEEEHENIEFEVPVRSFDISGFSFLEGTEKQGTAVYMSDLNFESEKVVVCGRIEDIRERNYTNSKNKEKVMYSFTLNDNTAMLRATYFPRMKSIDKIKELKIGDSIVCTGKSELYNGFIRFTANFIDYGKLPENFVPEKRASKPVPEYYSVVKPRPFSDISQTDMFTDNSVPACLKGKSFVVFDLETTGLNSSPSSGNMDRIIEIGAFKIIDGAICEQFSTFINPKRKLSEEIISLTGITEEMVAPAPPYEKVMPDFFKFCDGSILVGHNAAGFDFKFVDYYCASVGYMLERRIIDTLPLAQELLFLSNYKLNTVADKFGITFNHHRAIDDAYVTAKIFLELIKIKKSLPKLQ